MNCRKCGALKTGNKCEYCGYLYNLYNTNTGFLVFNDDDQTILKLQDITIITIYKLDDPGHGWGFRICYFLKKDINVTTRKLWMRYYEIVKWEKCEELRDKEYNDLKTFILSGELKIAD